MAKQTFTTGQVLTAAQMTSLQETAMGGGPATAKTANYVLVAADAGTTVAMNAAGSTTITVNSGLFAAGDTVFIQNLGAGACTVTAGTATVATAGSLILPQNDAGILYFTSASAAIFYDYIQVGATSPLTTKGDLYTFGTSDTRLAVGANGTTLVADSAEATGLKWATPSASTTSYTLLNSGGTSLSGSSTTVSSLSGYNKIFAWVDGYSISSNGNMRFRLNSDTGSNYYAASGDGDPAAMTFITVIGGAVPYTADIFINVEAANSTSVKPVSGGGVRNDGSTQFFNGYYGGSSVISSITIIASAGSFNGGTVYVYGAN